MPGEIPVPAITRRRQDDIAVFRPPPDWVRAWNRRPALGSPGTVPVPGDYDATARRNGLSPPRATGSWWIMGQARLTTPGGDMPVPATTTATEDDICIYGPPRDVVRANISAVVRQPDLVTLALDLDGDGNGRASDFHERDANGKSQTARAPGLRASCRRVGDQVTSPSLLTIFRLGGADGDRRADPTVIRPSTSTWYCGVFGEGLFPIVRVPRGCSRPPDYMVTARAISSVRSSAHLYVTRSSAFNAHTAPNRGRGGGRVAGDYAARARRS